MKGTIVVASVVDLPPPHPLFYKKKKTIKHKYNNNSFKFEIENSKSLNNSKTVVDKELQDSL